MTGTHVHWFVHVNSVYMCICVQYTCTLMYTYHGTLICTLPPIHMYISVYHCIGTHVHWCILSVVHWYVHMYSTYEHICTPITCTHQCTYDKYICTYQCTYHMYTNMYHWPYTHVHISVHMIGTYQCTYHPPFTDNVCNVTYTNSANGTFDSITFVILQKHASIEYVTEYKV